MVPHKESTVYWKAYMYTVIPQTSLGLVPGPESSDTQAPYVRCYSTVDPLLIHPWLVDTTVVEPLDMEG